METFQESMAKKGAKKFKGLVEEANAKSVISALIDTNWSSDNEAQMKAVQLLKGIALSDEPAANEFMKKLDKFTSSMKADDTSDEKDEK
jgi:hypothetical protein